MPIAQRDTYKGTIFINSGKTGMYLRRERRDLDVEEDGHGGLSVLLDEVEPDGGLVGGVLDHPVHAVLHCTSRWHGSARCSTEFPTGTSREERRVPQRKPSAGERGSGDEVAGEGEEGLCMSAAAGDHRGLAAASARRGGSDSSPLRWDNSQSDPGPSLYSSLSREEDAGLKGRTEDETNGDGESTEVKTRANYRFTETICQGGR
jgi:hypothetical protein